MTVVSVLLASLAYQGNKPSDLRVVEVKPAGLAVSVPKSWAMNKKEGNVSASLRIPIPDSKNFGRMEIGYVGDESSNIEGFLEASKNVLTVGGNTVERQWKVDILDSPLALTRYSKDGATTVRGVLFRPSKSKFFISISSVTEDFAKIEPYLLSTLESMRVIKIVQPKQPVVAVDKKVLIQKEYVGSPKRLPISQPLQAGGKNVYLHFPGGTKLSKGGESSVTATVPGTENTVVFTVYASEGNPASNVYQGKAAETSKLFAGSITRIDETYPNNPDHQVRDFVWRTGFAAKNSAPLLTADCVISQVGPYFVYAFFTSSNAKEFKKERKAVTEFLRTVNLTDKS